MRKTLFSIASVLLLSSAASAQTLDRQVDSAGARVPGATGTPADIVTVPHDTAGAAVKAPVAPFEGRSEAPAKMTGGYQGRDTN